jgi:hypothetical protein
MFFPGLPAFQFPAAVDGNALYRFSDWIENDASGSFWTLAVTRLGRRASHPRKIRAILVGAHCDAEPFAKVHRGGLRFSALRATRSRQALLLPKVAGFFGVKRRGLWLALVLAFIALLGMSAIYHWDHWGAIYWQPYYPALSLSRHLAELMGTALPARAIVGLFWAPVVTMALALMVMAIGGVVRQLGPVRIAAGVYYLGFLMGLPFSLLTLALARHLNTAGVRRSAVSARCGSGGHQPHLVDEQYQQGDGQAH